MNALLLEHGIENLPDVVEENALLIEQNVILIEQRESDVKSLLLLQEKLDVIRARYAEATHKAGMRKRRTTRPPWVCLQLHEAVP